jgi:hypothetical protein
MVARHICLLRRRHALAIEESYKRISFISGHAKDNFALRRKYFCMKKKIFMDAIQNILSLKIFCFWMVLIRLFHFLHSLRAHRVLLSETFLN